jgi:VWFA-related protein
LLPAVRLLRSQQSDPSSTFSTDVQLVNLFATVRDKEGRIVKNLTKDNFSLEEDGKPQVIRYFAQQSDLPLTLGLLVDTSRSEQRMLGTEREATRTFLEQVLRPEKDKAFLIHFDHDVELLQDLTSSRQRLEKALELLEMPQDQRGGGQGGGRRGAGHGGGTAFYDAIYLAADEVMKPQSGRKALIMLTDGEDNASKISLSDAISSAGRADTIAYSVRIADEESGFNPGGFGGPGLGGRHGGMGGGGMGGGRGGRSGMPHTDGKKILKQISKETGGAYFEKSKKKSVDQIYSQIEDELRNQYSFGFTPAAGGESGFRRITLTAKPSGTTVQTRDGYYAGTNTGTRKSAPSSAGN